MRKIFPALICISFLSTVAWAQIDLNKIKIPKGKVSKIIAQETNGTGTGLTESEIIQGLKEALTKGSGNASAILNKQDGYNLNPKIRIPFPPDAQKVAKTLRDIGYGKKVDEFELTLNRSAEQAAKEAAPIFKSAITNMSFTDAKGILTGSDSAATIYLRNTTYDSLYTRFAPPVKTALDNTTATHKWTELATLYNKLPTTRTKVETDLVAYTTHKALKGLFVTVAEEELKIRKDPMARTSDILKKVFGQK
ncbi:MAG TPA: DUF4197 domain-containing protein [Cytophagaceae bacterium]|jgi:hypothetical protein|nr:DUF4197 domain-containing protein [Cytophagaceae bacterium]